MISEYDQWVLARLLCGRYQDDDIAAVSDSCRPITLYLAGLPLESRLAPLEGWLHGRADAAECARELVGRNPSEPPPRQARLRSAHLGDLTASAADRFIWPGWLVRNHFNLFSSNPKIGKTRLTLDLARRIWFGLPWPDGQSPTFPPETPTMWVCGDRHQDELREIAVAYGLPPEAVRLSALPEQPYGGWDLDDPANIQRLGDLAAAERPALIVLDTLWRATRRRLCREDDVNALMDPLITLAQECDTTPLGNMHLSRDMETLGRRLEGAARAILKLFRPDPAQPDRRRMEVTGNFKPSQPLGVTLHDRGCDFDANPPQDAPGNDVGRPADKCGKAIAFLTERLAQEDRKLRELLEEWLAQGESKPAFFSAKKQMVNDGRMAIDRSGKLQVCHLIAGSGGSPAP